MKNNIIVLALLSFAFMFNSCSSGGDDSPTIEDIFSIKLSNSSLSFGDITINTTKTEDFTITNTGNRTVNITGINTPDGFTLSATTASITPANSITVTVTFSPTEVKSYSGMISITSNSTSTENSISVTGTGSALPDTFTTSLSSTSLSFGDITINTTKTEDFTIMNTGNQNIDVTNITAPDGFTLSATTATITPSNSITITVTFSPTEVKSYSGTINITSNSTSPENSLTVSGNGVAVVSSPTYTLNIAPIINGNCISCHGNPPTNNAPMSLTTYSNVKDAVENRGLIGRVKNGSMPKNGTPLTAEQIQLIKDWRDAGYLEN